MSETTPLWRVLAMHAGSNADAVDALTFFGVERERILAPVVVYRRPVASGRQTFVKTVKRWKYKPVLREVVTPLLPGYVFVRCDDPVECGKVDWAVQGRGALLRPQPLAEPATISNKWIDGLRALCKVDSLERMRIDASEVARLAPKTTRGDVIHKALCSGRMTEARMISGPFEGTIVQIEPVIDPDELVNALTRLDQKGVLRIVISMFGNRRAIDVPREQVDVIGECMPSHA